MEDKALVPSAIGEIAAAREIDLTVAREIAKRIHGLLGDKLQRVVLFGSRARGDFHEDSDYDFVIIADFDEPSWPKRAVDISRFVKAERELRIPVDYIPVTEWEFENKFLLQRTVKEEGVVLFERGNGILGKES